MTVSPHSGIIDFGTFTSPVPPNDGIQGEVPAPLSAQNGYILSTSGWIPNTGGGGTPGGSDTQVQFNDGGSFGGDSGLVYNKTTNALTISAGSLNFAGSTSGIITLQSAAIAGTYTLTLPNSAGSNGQALLTDGSGGLSWGAVGGTPGGSNTQIQFNNSGVFGGDASFTWNNTSKLLTVSGQISSRTTNASTVITAAALGAL